MVVANPSGGLWQHLYGLFRNFRSKLSEWLSPASEASSDETAYRISIELPGVSEEDIHLSATNDTLTVSGEKTETSEDKGESWHFSERQDGTFRRAVRFPPDAPKTSSAAHIKVGILNIIVLRHPPEERQGHRIEVKKG